MALNGTGPISVEDINVELGRAAAAAFSMDGIAERELANQPTGSYLWSEFNGKAVPYAGSFLPVLNPNLNSRTESDSFGHIISMSETYFVIGAPATPDGANNYSGVVHIYSVATGLLLRTLDNPNSQNTSAGDYFGLAVANSDLYCVVGSQENTAAGASGGGVVYIFDITNGNLLQTINDYNDFGSATVGTQFGRSLDMVGSVLAIGSNGEETAGAVAGSGVVYIVNAATGGKVRTIVNPNDFGTEENDSFGYFISMDGDKLAVGVPQEDYSGGTTSGKVYIFQVSTGSLLQTIDNPNAHGTEQGDEFGSSIDLSGDFCIVGAYRENDDDYTGNNVGRAYVFDVTDGSLKYNLENPNAYGTTQFDTFGLSVGITSRYFIAGARGEDTAADFRTGVFYMYKLSDGSLVKTFSNPNAYDTPSDDVFGDPVYISENMLLGCATGEDSDQITTAYPSRSAGVVYRMPIYS